MARAFAAHFRTRADVKRIFGPAPALLQEIRDQHASPVTVPCLVIWGKRDRLTLVSGAQVLGERVPAAEVVILDDCGHCSQVTRPDLVAQHLARFAEELTRASAPRSGSH
jgi:pimeloyl-ACP methyl ester carboxylesterase